MCRTTAKRSIRTQLKIYHQNPMMKDLTHWGRVTHICVSKLTIIGSDNGFLLDRRQAIIWTSAGLLLIGPLGTPFSEILIEILTFSFKKMRLKVSSAKRRPFCLGLNVLTMLVVRDAQCHATVQCITCVRNTICCYINYTFLICNPCW